jgi:hypothetical protein
MITCALWPLDEKNEIRDHDHMLMPPLTDYRLQITDYRLQITDYRLQITDYTDQLTFP